MFEQHGVQTPTPGLWLTAILMRPARPIPGKGDLPVYKVSTEIHTCSDEQLGMNSFYIIFHRTNKKCKWKWNSALFILVKVPDIYWSLLFMFHNNYVLKEIYHYRNKCVVERGPYGQPYNKSIHCSHIRVTAHVWKLKMLMLVVFFSVKLVKEDINAPILRH